jgi:hypothetical protein
MPKAPPHLQLSLSRELWNELLRAALPVKLTDGKFDLLRVAKRQLKQLGVRDQIAGLLEDRAPAQVNRQMTRLRETARAVWKRGRADVYKRVDEAVRVEGQWHVELDNLGTELRYGRQRVGADAYVKATASGTIWLLRKNIELPFVIEKRVGASVALADIHYDPGHKAVIGSLQDLELFLGQGILLELLSRAAEKALATQLPKASPVPILKREQVESMVGPIGGPLKLKMGVEDLELEITEDDMTLKVRFGFTQKQLTDQGSPEIAEEW